MSTSPIPDPAYPEYADLITEARRRSTGFIDPGVLATATSIATTRGPSWCEAVLGHYFHGVRWLTYEQTHLLILAAQAGIDPPTPQWMLDARQERVNQATARDEARARHAARDRAEWAAIVEHVTVALVVYASSHARVRLGFAHHLGHAVPEVDVYSGTRRIRTHPAGRALCETVDRGKPLGLRYEPEPAGTPVTCQRCRTWAPRVRSGPPR